MKYLMGPACAAWLALAAQSHGEVEQGVGFPSLKHASDPDGGETKLGIEAVTGFRSEYVFRGIKLANNVLDFQLQGEVALDNNLLVHLGGWYASNSDKFSESAEFAGIRYDNRSFALGTTLTARQPVRTVIRSGVDVSPYATWHVNPDINVTLGAAYNSAATGWYQYLETEWTLPVDDSSYFGLLAGVSRVQRYYNRQGGNDIYARLEYTYNINRSISLTPFVGSSIALDSHTGTDRYFGGAWFAVNF